MRRDWRDPETNEKSTIFLGYTSNLVSSRLRSTLRWLLQHSHIRAKVTTAGGIEEDFIKCLAPTYHGSFSAQGAGLKEQNLYRIGNMFIRRRNYAAFYDWLMPILDAMLEEQEESKARAKRGEIADKEVLNWTPMNMIWRLGKEIDDESSIYYWAYRNRIPVFCPSLTDGSIGDLLFAHSHKTAPHSLKLDIVEDM